MGFKKYVFLIGFITSCVSQAGVDVKDLSFSSQPETTKLSDHTSCPKEVFNDTSAQYIFIGESHPDGQLVSFFKHSLPLLKNKGFDVFFAEYIDSSDQYIIDKNFYEQGDPLPKIGYLFSDWGYDFSKYEKITSYVRLNDFRLVAMDRRRDLQVTLQQNERMAIRDFHMFNLAVDFIDLNPNTKIIFYNGSLHSHINTGLPKPSFYAWFKEYYPDKTTLNVKFDNTGFYDFSPQKKKIFELNSGNIDLGCESKSFFFKDPDTDEFNYYGFKDNSLIYPVQDSIGVLL